MNRRDTLITITCVLALFGLLIVATVLGARSDDRAAAWRDIATDQAHTLKRLQTACTVHTDGSAECPVLSFQVTGSTTTPAATTTTVAR